MAGHLFIVHGDLTAIACDAILIPTDAGFSFNKWWDSLELEEPITGWGGSKVIRYRIKPKEPQIWLGNIGLSGNDNAFADYQPTVEEFVRRAKAEIPLEREGRIYPWPKLRLAVNVVGSDHGGGRGRIGEFLLGLVTLLRSLAHDHDVDIVLVTYGDKDYAGAQRARRRILREIPGRRLSRDDWKSDWHFADFTPDSLPTKAADLANKVITNMLVLFIGAGVSAGAGVPIWGDLLAKVAEDGGVDKRYLDLLGGRDYRDWATLIDRKLGSENDIRDAVVAVIEESPFYALQHALLASLSSAEAVTTNFDQLFERASRVADRDRAVLPAHPQSAPSSWLLKLHGSIDKPADMVLTRSDYLNMPRYRGALIGLVQGLLLTRHMMYVGYSLSDEDFLELIDEVRSARGDSYSGGATMLTLRADQAQRDLWENEIDIVAMVKPGVDEASKDEEAARQLEIFLDLVGFLSTTSAAFLLDRAYHSLSEDERELRDLLSDLADYVGTQKTEPNSVARKVSNFLEGLGAERRSKRVSFTTRITAADLKAGRIRFPRSSTDDIPEHVATVMVELRGTPLIGIWRPNVDRHGCAELQLEDPAKFAVLVELGERLEIKCDSKIGIVLK